MKTLADYDLQKGDFFKHPDGKWYEFEGMTTTGYGDLHYNFYEATFAAKCAVEAVLRPSVIIRDILDRQLACRNVPILELAQGLRFQQIHPKEEKKSLIKEVFGHCYVSPAGDLIVNERAIGIICEEIDKLKEGK